jgi:hypothetical protein
MLNIFSFVNLLPEQKTWKIEKFNTSYERKRERERERQRETGMELIMSHSVKERRQNVQPMLLTRVYGDS